MHIILIRYIVYLDVVDICVNNANNINLIDLDTLNGDEDYLLISYPELVTLSNAMEQDKTIKAELRMTDHSIGVQPSSRNLYGFPVDIRDASSMEDLINFMQREDYKAKHKEEEEDKKSKK